MSRSAYWDNAKAILIALVVVGHLAELCIKAIDDDFAFKLLHSWIYIFHMPAFIFISGYFVGKSSKEPISKISKFIYLYLVMAVLYACVSLVEGNGFELRLANPRLGLWFLLFMVYAHVVAQLVIKNKTPWVLLISIVVGLIAGIDSSIGTVWQVGRAFYFMPFFIAGMCLDVEKLISLVRGHRTSCAFCLLLAGVLMYFLLSGALFDRGLLSGGESYDAYGLSFFDGITTRMALYLFSALVMLAFLGLIGQKHSLLTSLGAKSLDIYLVSTFLQGAVYPALSNALPFEFVGDLACFILLTVIACAVVIVCHNLYLSKFSAIKTKSPRG